MTRRFLCLLLAALMACPPVVLAESTTSGRKKGKRVIRDTRSYKQRRSEFRALQQKRAELMRQLRHNKAREKETLAEISKVDAQLDVAQEALEDTTQNLREKRKEQRHVGAQLEEATEQLNTVREQVRQRLKRMYVSGGTSTVSVLLRSKTAGELASRSESLAMVANADRAVFADYRAARARVANRKKRADELVVKVSDLANRQRKWKGRLESTLDTKKVEIRSIQSDRAKIEAALAQIDSDMRQIRDQIVAWLRMMRRRRKGKPIPAYIGRFLRPVGGRLTSGFGYRNHPIVRRRRLHAGVDFGAPHGASVRAAAPGEVIAAYYMRGYGNTIIIDHGGEIATVYAHLSRIGVRAGQRVQRGQTIGAVGSTGLSTGPHLHWEVRVRGNPVNPMGRQ